MIGRSSGQRRWLVEIAVAGCAVVWACGVARGQVSPAAGGLPKGAVGLFDGRDASQWVRRGTDRPATWRVADGVMHVHGGDIATRETYRDFQLHLEWMEPDLPNARGQAKGNSGIGLQGRYEIQILDSFGYASPGKGDCGSVYNQAAPLVNACKPALQWQTFDILFRAPRLDATGKITERPRVTVIQNGTVIQNNTEIQGPTGIQYNFDRDETKPGPIVLQDHGHAVQFRSIWIVPLPEKGSDQYAPRQSQAVPPSWKTPPQAPPILVGRMSPCPPRYCSSVGYRGTVARRARRHPPYAQPFRT